VTRGVTVAVEKDVIVWYHEVRNGQYHVGGATVPQRRELDGARAAALEVFSTLFDEGDVAVLLEEHIAALSPLPLPPRMEEHDRVIDSRHGMIEVCGESEYVSAVLYALDPVRYREIALELLSGKDSASSGDNIQDSE
jgi:hypothetical protein